MKLDMHHPEDLQTVVDLAASLNANEPAVVVSLGRGRVLALGGPGLPPALLNELAAVVVRYVEGRPTWQ